MKCLFYTVYADGHVTEREFLPQDYEAEKKDFFGRVASGIIPIKGGFIRVYETDGERYEQLMPHHVKGFLRYQQHEAAA